MRRPKKASRKQVKAKGKSKHKAKPAALKRTPAPAKTQPEKGKEAKLPRKAHKGRIIYWTINRKTAVDRTALEKKLEELGSLSEKKDRRSSQSVTFADLLPRNDYKNALLRGLRVVLKKDEDDERFYRRHNDIKKSVDIVVTLVEEIKEKDGSDYQYKKELKITLDKESGAITFDKETGMNEQIREEYRRMQKLADSNQLSQLIYRIINDEVYAAPVKSGSGVYYVPENLVDRIESVSKVINLLPKNCKLRVLQMTDDRESKEAAQEAVYDEIVSKLDTFRNNVVTKAEEAKEKGRDADGMRSVLGSREAEIEDVERRARLYRDDLADKSREIDERLQAMRKALSEAQKKPLEYDIVSIFNNI